MQVRSLSFLSSPPVYFPDFQLLSPSSPPPMSLSLRSLSSHLSPSHIHPPGLSTTHAPQSSLAVCSSVSLLLVPVNPPLLEQQLN